MLFLVLSFIFSFNVKAADDEHLYLKAQQEYESGDIDEALWSKSMTLTGGDKEKAKYKYISLRVEKLISENNNVRNQNSFEEIKSTPKKLDENKEIDQKNQKSDIKFGLVSEEKKKKVIKFEDLSKDQREEAAKNFRKTLDDCVNDPERKLLIQIYQNNGFTEWQARSTVCSDLLGSAKNIHKENKSIENLKYIGLFNFDKYFHTGGWKFSYDENGKIISGIDNFKFVSRLYIDDESFVKTSVDCGKELNKRKIENKEYRQFYFIKDNDRSYWTPYWSKAFYDPKKTNVKETMSSSNLIQFSCKRKNKYRFLSRSFYSENLLKGELLAKHPTDKLKKNSSQSFAIMTFPPFFLPTPGAKGLNIYKALNEFICEMPDEKFIDKTNQNNNNTCTNPKSSDF